MAVKYLVDRHASDLFLFVCFYPHLFPLAFHSPPPPPPPPPPPLLSPPFSPFSLHLLDKDPRPERAQGAVYGSRAPPEARSTDEKPTHLGGR